MNITGIQNPDLVSSWLKYPSGHKIFALCRQFTALACFGDLQVLKVK
jgi:hypothetical protein